MMKVYRGAAAGIAAASLLLLAACGDGDAPEDTETGAAEDSGNGDSGDDGVLAVVDHMYGPTEVLEPEDGELTVVALGWSDAEIALALGVEPVAVHDWLGFGEETHGVGPWASDLFTDVEPEVLPRAEGELDYELIQSFDPDVILNVNSGYDEAEYNRLAEIAPTISGPEGAENYNPGWDNHTLLVAEALGKAEEGQALVDETEALFEQTREEYPEFEGVEAVTASKFGEAYGLNFTGDMRWDLLDFIGFEMYGPAAEMDPEQGFYADVSEEQVEVFDAEVAVFYPIGFSLEDLENDPLLNSLDVVQDDRAVLLDGEGDVVQAFSAGSVLSIPFVIDELAPQLAEAVENVE